MPAVAPSPVAETAPSSAEPAPAQPEASTELPRPEAAPEPKPVAEPEGADLLPKAVEIRYTLYKGRNGLAVGQTLHSWKLEGKQYTINNTMEATGLFTLFASGKHIQVSQGEVTAQGLKPASYQVQRGQADRTDNALFDWQAMSLTLGAAGETRTVRLPEKTQDLLSFLYQLAFAPPQGGATELYITNGRKLDRYGYVPNGEETLETPMGPLKTLRISKVHNPGEEGTEIWLATEYHYLPVKIRHIDKSGDSAEQVATAIHLQ